jgi:hypothetical protein
MYKSIVGRKGGGWGREALGAVRKSKLCPNVLLHIYTTKPDAGSTSIFNTSAWAKSNYFSKGHRTRLKLELGLIYRDPFHAETCKPPTIPLAVQKAIHRISWMDGTFRRQRGVLGAQTRAVKCMHSRDLSCCFKRISSTIGPFSSALLDSYRLHYEVQLYP